MDGRIRELRQSVGDVVAGVGGGDAPESAFPVVDWAADEAARRGAGLRLVHVEPDPGRRAAPGTGEVLLERARRVAPAVPVRFSRAGGEPGHALLRECDGAALLVLGGRGDGRNGPGVTVGSPVVAFLAAHAPVPVVVTGPEVDRGESSGVVVSCQGCPLGFEVAELAAGLAASRHSSLTVVRVWNSSRACRAGTHGATFHCCDPRGEAALELDETVAELLERHPDLSIRPVLARGDDPAVHLLAASASAALLVVGVDDPCLVTPREHDPGGADLLSSRVCTVVLVPAGRAGGAAGPAGPVAADRRTAQRGTSAEGWS